MAPRKAANTKASPKKSPAKAGTGVANQRSKSERDLLFLWTYVQINGLEKVSHHEVAAKWGITANAASKRFSRLKAEMQALQEAETEREDGPEETQEEETQEGEAIIKAEDGEDA